MNVRIRQTAFHDRRTDEFRRYSDNVEERRWRARVWLNEKRWHAESRRQIQVVGRLESLGSNRQGASAADQPGPVSQPDPGSSGHPTHPTWTLVSVRAVQRGWTNVRRLLEGAETAR